MLLTNPWVGPTLKQWEETKTLSRTTKIKAYWVIILTFTFSVVIFRGQSQLQLILVGLGILLVLIVWRIKEEALVPGPYRVGASPSERPDGREG